MKYNLVMDLFLFINNICLKLKSMWIRSAIGAVLFVYACDVDNIRDIFSKIII